MHFELLKKNHANKYLRAAASLLLVLSVTNTYAESWFDNTRLAFDTSARVAYETKSDNTDGFIFTGIDAHRVFSTNQGDIGTLLVQVYAATLQDVEGHPPIFDDEDDTEITYRSVYFNYTALSNGSLNIKARAF